MFLDSNVLIELLTRDDDHPMVHRILDAIGNGPAFACIVQIAELADFARRGGVDPDLFARRARSIVGMVALDEPIILEASRIKDIARQAGRTNFGVVDALVLASARAHGRVLLTMDRAFEGLDGVAVIPGVR